MLLAFISFSCENDGGTSVINFTEGAVPNIKKIANTDQGLNIVALKAGQNINIGLTVSVGTGDVVSMDIIGVYTKGTVVEKGILKANVTGFPATVNITQTDLYKAFNLLNSANDVDLTDKLVISADLTLKNGTVVKMFTDKGIANYGADVANSLVYSVLQNYIVSCPLTDASLFNGNYKVVTDVWADYSINDIVPVVYNAANGTFKFRVMNSANPSTIAASSANYLECTINPTLATVTVVSSAPYLYGAGAANSFTVAGTGTVASCTGDINLTLTWTRSSGSFANQKFNLVKL